MSKQVKINTAQQILYALGVTFPLYSQMRVDKSRTSTKKGPGRRHLQGRTAPFAERLVALAKKRWSDGHVGAWLGGEPTACTEERGDWGLLARNGIVYTRGNYHNLPLFAAKGI